LTPCLHLPTIYIYIYIESYQYVGEWGVNDYLLLLLLSTLLITLASLFT